MAHAIMGPCSLCGGRSVGKDIFGYGWCEKHALRIAVAQYGKATNYRAVNVPPYAIGEGHDLWKIAVAVGNDKFMQAVYAAIQAVMQTVTPNVEMIAAMLPSEQQEKEQAG
jgi:hypothetical protein